MATPHPKRRQVGRGILPRNAFSPNAHLAIDLRSCHSGVSFAPGENGTCKVDDFTLLNVADEYIEIARHCLISWNVNVWIVMNAIILKGVKVRENSVVAAGAILSKAVGANVVLAVNPAVITKQL